MRVVIDSQDLFEPQTGLLRYVLEQPYSREMVCNMLGLNKQVTILALPLSLSHSLSLFAPPSSIVALHIAPFISVYYCFSSTPPLSFHHCKIVSIFSQFHNLIVLE